MVGSLTMLILDKKVDIGILHSMGATQKTIRKVFIYEGMLISMISAVSGLILGGLICWLQQTYGLIKLGSGQGSFVVDAYPVKMQVWDFVFVFLTVVIIGFGASWLPARQISIKRMLRHFVNF
jgi:lipoprotein-releasing system permease protein